MYIVKKYNDEDNKYYFWGKYADCNKALTVCEELEEMGCDAIVEKEDDIDLYDMNRINEKENEKCLKNIKTS